MADVTGTSGNDDLVGGSGPDRLDALSGDDRLDGGGGGDVLLGGSGDDAFVVDDVADVIFEEDGGGKDIVRSLVSFTLNSGAHVEILQPLGLAGMAPINLTGNELDNSILGNAGDNILDGGSGGLDRLKGFGGGDVYFVDTGDVVLEDADGGHDIVKARESFVLTAGAFVEILQTAATSGADSINLTGNELNNRILGNAGDNILDGGSGGLDRLKGFGGDDVYFVGDRDIVIEGADEGRDIVKARESFVLSAGAFVEILQTAATSGTDWINLTGNELDNIILGNAGRNILDGGNGGIDRFKGFGGDDVYYVQAGDTVLEDAGGGRDVVKARSTYVLDAAAEVEILQTANHSGTSAINLTGNEFDNRIIGNAGDNVLKGLGGSDVLLGNGGADRFVFSTAPAAGIDTILDFEGGTDTIVLAGAAGQPFSDLASGSLAAGAFVIGSSAVAPEDMIVYDASTGALYFDADGNGASAAIQFATLQAGLSLTAADFAVTGPTNAAPIITSGGSGSVSENSAASTIVYQAVAADADGDRIVYSLSGADAAAFTIDQGGAVRLASPADFETRSAYDIIVNAADSSGSGASRAVAVSVTDVDETSGPTPSLAETSAANNSTGQAQAVSRALLDDSTNGNLFDDSLPSITINGAVSTGAPNADIDFFSITLNAGEKLILDVDGSGGDLDAVVRIYDTSGRELGFVDDSPVDPGSTQDYPGRTWDSFLTWRAPTAGTYYFSIESWGDGVQDGPGTGETTGNYQLNVSIGPPATAAQILEEDIEALIGSAPWPDPNSSQPGTNLTFAFPNSPADYPAGIPETANNFEAFNAIQRTATTQILQQISHVADLTFTQLFDNQESGATLRYAMSDEPEVAYAYLPGGDLGGTAWFRNSPIEGRTTPAFDNPVAGGYAWMSIIHETGHALGLKHGHEFPAVSFNRDSVEFTVMTYRSYVGQPPNGYTNETWGFPTTLMALDIAALQRLYGANFNFNSGDSVYTWSPTTGQSFVNGVGGLTPGGNRVFMTVWDGDGNDTYNLSNYASPVTIDLRPGEWTITSQIQLANLGINHFARGNVLNAFLYNDDPHSLIENAVAGSGNDTLIANQAVNTLTGGAGGDIFRWHDDAAAAIGPQLDLVLDFARGQDKIDLGQIDAIAGTPANDSFNFIGSSAFHDVAGELRFEVQSGSVRVEADLNGDGIADMAISLNGVTSLAGTDFIL